MEKGLHLKCRINEEAMTCFHKEMRLDLLSEAVNRLEASTQLSSPIPHTQ